MPSHDRDSGIPELLGRRLRVGLVLVAGGFALLAAGCGGDGSDDPESFPPIDADVDASTSQPSVSAVDSDAGDGVTPSSSTSTTVAGATTADGTTEKPDLDIPTEWDSDLDEIFGRYQLYWEAFYIAAGPPVPDIDYAPLLELTAPEAIDDLGEDFEVYEDDEVVLVLPEDSISQHVLRLPNPTFCKSPRLCPRQTEYLTSQKPAQSRHPDLRPAGPLRCRR